MLGGDYEDQKAIGARRELLLILTDGHTRVRSQSNIWIRTLAVNLSL